MPLLTPVLLRPAPKLMLLAYTLMGPAMLVAPPMVTVSVRVVLTLERPTVSPVTLDEIEKSVMGQVTAELKLSL